MTLEMRWLPKEHFTANPQGGPYFRLLRDHYWAVNSTGELLVAVEKNGVIRPQCNTDPRIVDYLVDRTPGVDHIERIHLAWVPIKPEDYR